MSSFPFTGAGDPTSYSGFSGPYGSAGAGAPLEYPDFPGDYFPALGSGDPFSTADVTFVVSFNFGGYWSYNSPEYSPLRNPDPYWLSQEGGYTVELFSAGQMLYDGPYRVDLIDAAGQSHPILEPGCYGGVQDGGSEINPEPNGMSLVFGSPPTPLGEYTIRVSDKFEISTTVSGTVLAVPVPDSNEVNGIRSGLPNTVFVHAYPDKSD